MLNGNNYIKAKKKKKKGSNLKIFCNLKMFIKDPDVHRSLQLSLRDS